MFLSYRHNFYGKASFPLWHMSWVSGNFYQKFWHYSVMHLDGNETYFAYYTHFNGNFVHFYYNLGAFS